MNVAGFDRKAQCLKGLPAPLSVCDPEFSGSNCFDLSSNTCLSSASHLRPICSTNSCGARRDGASRLLCGAAQFIRYRCRKCRRLLATERNVVEVEAGPGPGAFPWRKRDRGPSRSGGEPDANVGLVTSLVPRAHLIVGTQSDQP